jgi:tartrate dehydratase beta subunit/fumarate hydratase class I family protein
MMMREIPSAKTTAAAREPASMPSKKLFDKSGTACFSTTGGAEAIRRLQVKDFPVFVVNDIHGSDLYEESIITYTR